MEQYINLALFLALVIYPLPLAVITWALEGKENKQMSGEKEVIRFLDNTFPEHTDIEKYIELLYLCFAGVDNGLFYAIRTDEEGGFVLVAPEKVTASQRERKFSTVDFHLLIEQLIYTAKELQ